MKLVILNGRVVDPGSARDETCAVWIDGATIAGVGRKPSGFTPDRTIDARGLVVSPGFIDLGARLREPGLEHKATIASELRAAAAGGFTAVCCTPDTDPPIDTPAVVELINQRARGVRGAAVHCIGALTRGLGGAVLAEMHALADIGCVGVGNAGHAIEDTGVLRNAMAYAATLGMTVFVNAEDPWLGRLGVMHEGAASTRQGLAGIPAAAELIGLERDLELVRETGVRAHFRTLSTAEAPALVTRARRGGLAVSADVGINHLFCCDEDIDNFNGNYHVRPPLRARRDRAALQRALAGGRIDALSAHHEPHDADAKAAPFAASDPGISGFDTFAALGLDLVRRGKLELTDFIRVSSTAPAAILGFSPHGITTGARADLCLLDTGAAWTVTPDAMLSQGRNTPFMGKNMTGRVVLTVVGGRVVFERDTERTA